MQARLATLRTTAEINGDDRQRRARARASPPSTSRPTRTPAARTPRTSSPRPSATSSLAYRDANPSRRLRRDRRCRRRHPVLPLPRRRRPRPGVRLRAAGAGHERVAGQPAAQLLPVAGRLRRDDRAAAQGRHAAGARPAGRPARRDAGRDHRHDRRLPRPTGVARRPTSSSLVTGYDFLTDGAQRRAGRARAPASAAPAPTR